MIGQLSNRVFLTDLYFGSAWNQNQRYNFALWNYCSGTSNSISSCAHPTPAFNWASTPDLSTMLQSQANSRMVNNLFMAMFVLFFIGCCWGFLIWLASMPICCFKRRALGFSMLTLVLINFFVMLVALILALVLVISGVKHVSANQGWDAGAGNLLWITIGAVIALLLAAACYSCGSATGGRKKKRVDPEEKYAYQDQYSYGNHYGQPTNYQNQTTNQADGNPPMGGYDGQNQMDRTMLQQSYQDMGSHDVTQQTPNEPVSQGYQTPTLQHT
ncbi:hypothetical protein G6F56_009315 [Rhizopus delemar]|nr:hypothetical protein G6F56_009315 [Rhizopus delemar]